MVNRLGWLGEQQAVFRLVPLEPSPLFGVSDGGKVVAWPGSKKRKREAAATARRAVARGRVATALREQRDDVRFKGRGRLEGRGEPKRSWVVLGQRRLAAEPVQTEKGHEQEGSRLKRRSKYRFRPVRPSRDGDVAIDSPNLTRVYHAGGLPFLGDWATLPTRSVPRDRSINKRREHDVRLQAITIVATSHTQ